MTQKAAGQTNQAVKAPAAVPQLLLQRACACGRHTSGGGECAECRKKSEGTLQRSAFGPASVPAVPPIVHDVLRAPGRPLDGAARAFMEPRFGRDFSGVRVHADDRAAESARSVQALAYTVGRDVVFGAGQYAPATKAGRGLLAHELTHVVQQDGASHAGQLQHKLSLSSPGDAGEREADQMAAAVVSGRDGPVPGFRASAPVVQRACGPTEVGTVAGCIGVDGDVACASSNCQRVHFVVNCDDFTAGDEALLLAFAATVAPGDSLEVHGFASQDGDPTFNENLSCLRAQKAIATLTDPAKGNVAAAQIGSPFMHGATDGPKAERRSVEILKTSTTPTPVPPVPVPPTPPVPVPPTPPGPAPPAPAPVLKFWINAFIPDTLSGVFPAPAGPFAGREVFKGPPAPFHLNSCFETDERGFTSALPVSSRLQVVAEMDTSTGTLTAASGLSSGFTFEIDCDTGAVKCATPATARGAGVGLIPPILPSSSRFDMPIEAFANDPCVAFSPDIAIRGLIHVDTAARTFAFTILTTLFPAIEMYVSVSGGTPTTLFTMSPPGSSPFLLGPPGVIPHTGGGTF